MAHSSSYTPLSLTNPSWSPNAISGSFCILKSWGSFGGGVFVLASVCFSSSKFSLDNHIQTQQPTARYFPNTPAESLSLTLTPVFPAVYWASSLAHPKGFSDLACLRQNESSSFLNSSLALSVLPVFGLEHRFPIDKSLTWRLFWIFPYFMLITRHQMLLLPNHLLKWFHNSDMEHLLLDPWNYLPLQTLISSVQVPHHSLRGLSKPHSLWGHCFATMAHHCLQNEQSFH